MWAEKKGRRCSYEDTERREGDAILRVKEEGGKERGLKEEVGCDKGDNGKRVQEGTVRGG